MLRCLVASGITAVLVSAAPASGVPDPRSCDANAGVAAICVSHGTPRAGQIFTGGYVWIRRPAQTTVTKLSCNAKLGGRIRRNRRLGATYFDGGVRLSPILRRFWSRPDAQGTRHLARATCSWRIPRAAHGLLLSLIHPTEHLGDMDTPWGLHFETGDSMRECNQTTWRVGLKGLVTPAPRFRRVSC